MQRNRFINAFSANPSGCYFTTGFDPLSLNVGDNKVRKFNSCGMGAQTNPATLIGTIDFLAFPDQFIVEKHLNKYSIIFNSDPSLFAFREFVF